MERAMRAKMVELMKRSGMKQEMMTGEMVEVARQAMQCGALMMKTMMDNGMNEYDAMQLIKKFEDMLMSPDMVPEVEKLMEDKKPAQK